MPRVTASPLSTATATVYSTSVSIPNFAAVQVRVNSSSIVSSFTTSALWFAMLISLLGVTIGSASWLHAPIERSAAADRIYFQIFIIFYLCYQVATFGVATLLFVTQLLRLRKLEMDLLDPLQVQEHHRGS